MEESILQSVAFILIEGQPETKGVIQISNSYEESNLHFLCLFFIYFMIYTTKGIVLRTIKYGETSVIASVFTERFGVQSYMVNNVRTSGKSLKAHFFQPSSILDLEVYHNELKNLQRIKDLKWSSIYKSLLSDVIKNSIALYMVEVLQKALKQPEPNADLFSFCEDAFLFLDTATNGVAANFPIYFSLQLAPFLGIRLHDNYSDTSNFFDISEGKFADVNPMSEHQVDADTSCYISELLKVMHPHDLGEIKINRSIRFKILQYLEEYYTWHVPEFGSLKTLPILSAIVS
ncbi:MAG: DNA repair protein RecO [Ginsengibacter sp.]